MNLRQSSHSLFVSAVLAAASVCSGGAVAAPLLFTDSGASASDIVAEVNVFRAALGNPNNGNATGLCSPGGARLTGTAAARRS